MRRAAVIASSSTGEFARWNPHLHEVFPEGGLDSDGRFVHVPSLDLIKLSQYFRTIVVAFFLQRTLIGKRLATNTLDWTHSGFRVDSVLKIPVTASKARESLAQ